MLVEDFSTPLRFARNDGLVCRRHFDRSVTQWSEVDKSSAKEK